jgi:hypothetical protein
MSNLRGAMLLPVLAVIVTTPSELTSQTVPFRGRVVMAAGGPPFRQMTIRLDRFATTTPNDGGFFSGAIPAGTSSMTIRVETGNPRWALRYPVGAVAVPRDTGFVTDIIVGPSIEETLSRDYASSMARLSAGLRSAGAADSQVIAAIDVLRREFAERTNLKVDELRAAEQLTSARAQIFPQLSAAIEAYLIKANNIAIAFQYLLESSFGSDSAFAQLRLAIVEYNSAFEALRTSRDGFENGVATNWRSPRLSADLRALLDYALGDIHSTEILPLNEVLPDVSRILTRRLQGNEAQTKRVEVLARVRTTVTTLRARLEELERRKIRVLDALQST